jgi:hypothetical protein
MQLHVRFHVFLTSCGYAILRTCIFFGMLGRNAEPFCSGELLGLICPSHVLTWQIDRWNVPSIGDHVGRWVYNRTDQDRNSEVYLLLWALGILDIALLLHMFCWTHCSEKSRMHCWCMRISLNVQMRSTSWLILARLFFGWSCPSCLRFIR